MKKAEKEPLNLSINKELKEKAKTRAKASNTSLSSVAERAFREFIDQEIKCPNSNCEAKYRIEIIGNKLDNCAKCEKPLV